MKRTKDKNIECIRKANVTFGHRRIGTYLWLRDKTTGNINVTYSPIS